MRSLHVLLAASVALICAMVVVAQDLAEIPADLKFSCEGRRYGYYADVEADCQVFHICMGQDQGEASEGKFSFLCPNQTMFNQQNFVCDWAANVDCDSSESLYYLNENFGSFQEVTTTTEEESHAN